MQARQAAWITLRSKACTFFRRLRPSQSDLRWHIRPGTSQEWLLAISHPAHPLDLSILTWQADYSPLI